MPDRPPNKRRHHAPQFTNRKPGSYRPRFDQAALDSATQLSTDGEFGDYEIAHPDGPKHYYSFHANEGLTYQIETELTTANNSLTDTIMELLETDGHHQIAESDDDPRATGRLDSFIEWTCPTTGLYYVSIQVCGCGWGWSDATACSSPTAGLDSATDPRRATSPATC